MEASYQRTQIFRQAHALTRPRTALARSQLASATVQWTSEDSRGTTLRQNLSYRWTRCWRTNTGTDAVPWKYKGLTHPNGWTCTLIVGTNYTLSFRNLTQVTNITYTGSFYEFDTDDHVRIIHVLKQEPDYFMTTTRKQNFSETVPPTTGFHGEWGFVNETKEFTYLVTGKDNTRDWNNNLAPKSILLRVSINHKTFANFVYFGGTMIIL